MGLALEPLGVVGQAGSCYTCLSSDWHRAHVWEKVGLGPAPRRHTTIPDPARGPTPGERLCACGGEAYVVEVLPMIEGGGVLNLRRRGLCESDDVSVQRRRATDVSGEGPCDSA